MRRTLLVIGLILSAISAHAGLNPNQALKLAADAVAGGGGGGTPTLVQSSCTVGSITDPISLTLASAFTAGNTSAIGIVSPGDAIDNNVASDNKGNVYTQYPQGGFGDAAARGAFFISTNTTSGGTSFTATVNLTGTGATLSMCVAEFSGVTQVKTSSQTTATSVKVNTGTATYTGTQALALGLMTFSTGGTITITPINSETQLGETENNSAFQAYNMVYKVLGSTPESMRWTAGSSIAWKAGMVILQ